MTYFSVQEVSDFHGITPRRVRQLLSEGRIDGFKDSHNIWQIPYPFDIYPSGQRSRSKSVFHRFRLEFGKGKRSC